jgi:peptide/nickel transport system permease protein
MADITASTSSGTALPNRANPVVAFIKSQPLGFIGFLIVLLYVVLAVGRYWIAPFDPTAMSLENMEQPPSLLHLFGTDQMGRDVFSRVVYGARTALLIGLLSAFIGCTIGALLGATSGYFGGRIDNFLQRIVDIMLSFPIIILAVVVVAVLGKWPIFDVDLNLIIAIALPMIPKMARIARSSTLSIVQMPFIDAARAAGYSHTRIVLRHIMPNIIAPYLIMVTAFIAQAILLEASLSFLGLGVTDPTPAWGLMLSGSSIDFARTAPWMIIFPGLAITLAVFAFNLLGDSLRDWLDPKMKG